MLNSAFDIIEKINNMGYDAYIVGGAVRDLILGHEPHDIDISTNCPLEIIEKTWPSYDIGQSKNFGIVSINYNGYSFEVANFRTEANYSDGRRPDEVNIAETFEEDSLRRDFSFNALGFDCEGNIVDFHNGRNHLNMCIVKTVGNPFERFAEDYLRILRAVRFAARLGFHIECETEKAMLEGINNLPKLSTERIHDELFKMASLGGKKFAHCIEMMYAFGILDVIMPEIAIMKSYNETRHWHPEAYAFGTGTVFDHTMQALRASMSNNAVVNMSILCHDIGKPVTHILKLDDRGERHSYHGHDMAGLKVFERMAKRLKFSNDEIEAIKFGIEGHMKMHKMDEMRATKVVALVTNKNWDLLKNVSFADSFASSMGKETFEMFSEKVNHAETVASKWISPENKPSKMVDGNMVMELCNLKPSKMVGDIVRRVTEMIVDENSTESVEVLIIKAFNEIK